MLTWTALLCGAVDGFGQALPYAIVDTGQDRCFSNDREIAYPQPGAAFDGQDAQFQGNAPAYKDNGDGKVSRQEFDGPLPAFDHLDRDSDGFLSDDEAPKGPPPGGGRNRNPQR
jgi:hypothetical protein